MASAAAPKSGRGVPVLSLVHVHQPEIGSCTGRGLERLPGFSSGQPSAPPAAQVLVHQRQQLFGGVRVALLNGRQDAGTSFMLLTEVG